MPIDRSNGLARASIATSVSPDQAFDALERADALGSWLGTPATPPGTLQPASLGMAGPTRIDFGDGDFFAVDRVERERPSHLRYVWRFLGVGPANRITWTVAARGTHTEITVIDQQTDRSDRETEAMREGWRDFLDRLARYLATGERTRYDWRRDVHGEVELACDYDQAVAIFFAVAGLDRWLPWRADAWQPGAALALTDRQAPAALRLRQIRRSAGELQLAITAPGWRYATSCTVTLSPRRLGSMLKVSHTGWDNISDDDTVQRAQRERFCRLWTDSLTRARSLGGSHFHAR